MLTTTTSFRIANEASPGHAFTGVVIGRIVCVCEIVSPLRLLDTHVWAALKHQAVCARRCSLDAPRMPLSGPMDALSQAAAAAAAAADRARKHRLLAFECLKSD